MTASRILVAAAALWLGGCAVTEYKYPLAWDPLLPPTSADCGRFEGSYADRGEMAGKSWQPSLTLGLFGTHSAWEDATRVDLSLPTEDTLEIRVWGKDKTKPLFMRSLKAQANDFTCKAGRLTVRNKRWVAGDMFSGREDVVIEFNAPANYLIAQINETNYGVLFAIVPITGTAQNWYRFPRLR
jgi:hypothetical protein